MERSTGASAAIVGPAVVADRATMAEPRATMEEPKVVIGTIATPIGVFGAALAPTGLGRLTFPTEPLAHCEAWARRWLPQARPVTDARLLAPLAEQLTAYFDGALRQFTLPVDLRGTPFQLQVWRVLQEVRYG